MFLPPGLSTGWLLRRRFAQFKLCAHLLDLRCHSEDGHKIMLD